MTLIIDMDEDVEIEETGDDTPIPPDEDYPFEENAIEQP